MTIIHSENILLEDMYVNSTYTKQAVGFDFSSLNVSSYIHPAGHCVNQNEMLMA